jgi:microcystin-dependent protein
LAAGGEGSPWEIADDNANNDTTDSNTTGITNQNTTATNQNTTATNQAATATNQNTGGDGAHNNMQPSQVATWIIKT